MKYLLILIFAYSLFAGTYNDNYKIQQESNVTKTKLDGLMYGDFQEIIRFKMLSFNEDKLENEINKDTNTTHLQDITNSIKKYIVSGESVRITIIGHTPESKRIVPSYIGQTVDTDKTIELSRKNAKFIQDALVKSEIKEELMTLEYRGGKDMAYSDALTKGKELSNRVMVTLYVEFPQDIDSDKDGVFDSVDKDPDAYNEISADSTATLSKGFKINFKRKSDKIAGSSYEQIVIFATLLKQNPSINAKIIGHADSTGKEEDNIELSQKRAAVVKSALIHEGVEASRLTTKGRGELDPIQNNLTKEGRAMNRRVDVELSKISEGQ